MIILWHFGHDTVVNSYAPFGVNNPRKKLILKELRLSVTEGLLSKSTKCNGEAKLTATKFMSQLRREQNKICTFQ